MTWWHATLAGAAGGVIVVGVRAALLFALWHVSRLRLRATAGAAVVGPPALRCEECDREQSVSVDALRAHGTRERFAAFLGWHLEPDTDTEDGCELCPLCSTRDAELLDILGQLGSPLHVTTPMRLALVARLAHVLDVPGLELQPGMHATSEVHR